jgi:hypothetical protein
MDMVKQALLCARLAAYFQIQQKGTFLSQTWCVPPVILALGRLRQED